MERLQSPRVWLVGGGLLALVIFALGWFVFVGPQLASAGDLRAQAATTRQTNEQLRTQVRSLEAKSTRLPQYTASLRSALAAVPYDSGLPAFTRQLNRQARANKVTVTSVVVAGVTPIEAVAPATSVAPTPTAGTSPSTSTSTGAQAAFAMQVTVQSNGPLRRQLAFLKEVQTGPRRALITATQVAPGTGSKTNGIDRAASLTTQLSVFSAPQSPAQIRQLNKLLRGDLGD